MTYSPTKSQLVYLPRTVGDQTSAALRRAFDVDFAMWDLVEGELIQQAPSQPGQDDATRGDLVRALGITTEPQLIADEDCAVLLAIPLTSLGLRTVAVAPFALRPVGPHENLAAAARLLCLDMEAARDWINTQTHWPVKVLLSHAELIVHQLAAERELHQRQGEIVQISDNLANTYEEICLLHAVTQKLQISRDDESLAEMVAERLLDALPLSGVAVELMPVARAESITYQARTEVSFVTSGDCPLDQTEFDRLIEHLRLSRKSPIVVANDNVTNASDWPFADIHELIVVPILAGERLYGWIAAFNHNANGSFGSVEANLLSSLASVLGTHVSNRDLFRQQAELLASVVRALTSAIDTKDPYTCGHSDRVARISVRLAKQLGCEAQTLHTLYMAGLLHDIGKIGIKDEVLSKPGKLTDEEFEHIKQHPGLGYRILADITQLSDVLPAVLHHHEQWNGNGYPCQLSGEQIPLIARIVAVADAYDAMTSDRPYRKGMPVAKVEAIFQNGSGSHFDPEVIEAYFACRKDILDLCQQERANLTLDVQQWT